MLDNVVDKSHEHTQGSHDVMEGSHEPVNGSHDPLNESHERSCDQLTLQEQVPYSWLFSRYLNSADA